MARSFFPPPQRVVSSTCSQALSSLPCISSLLRNPPCRKTVVAPLSTHTRLPRTLSNRHLDSALLSPLPIARRPSPTSGTTSTRSFRTSYPVATMSDADYAAFLDKANQDTGGASATTTPKNYSTKSVNTAVPQVLEQVEEYYISDADERFEPVALEWSGKGDVGADELKSLLNHGTPITVTELQQQDFDPKGQYKNVVEAVKKAASSNNRGIRVFRVEHGGTRVEYYVVSVDEKEGRVVGLKALSVES